MKKSGLYLALIFTILTGTYVKAQDNAAGSHTYSITIPEVALLDLESANPHNIQIKPVAPTEAGNALIFGQTNTDLWLNYSSIVGVSTRTSRKVTAQVASGTIPDGVQINLMAGAASGAGGGKLGTPVAGGILLTSTAQDLILGIGSSYTGDGPSNGHQLTYVIQSSGNDSYQNLRYDNSTAIGILYTITDN